MRRLIWSMMAVLALAVCPLLVFQSSSSQVIANPAPSPATPSTELLALRPELTIAYPGHIYQTPMVITRERNSIDIEWRYCPGPLGTGDLSLKVEQFATSYRPTTYTFSDSSMSSMTAPLNMYVIGRGRNDETILEQWDFIRIDTPQFIQADVPGSTVQYSWRLPPRRRVQEILRTTDDDLKHLTWVIPVHGAANRLIAQSGHSRKIFVIDTLSSAYTLVASPTVATPPALTEANLGTPLKSVWSAERPTHGFVYVLVLRPAAATPAVAVILLLDVDKSGSIDQLEVKSPQQWVSEGWSDTTSYSTVFKP